MTSPAPDAAVPDSPEPDGAATNAARQVTVRRAPRIGRIVVLGAGLGAIVTFILTAIFPVDPLIGFGALFGYFLLFGVPIGAAIGAIFAITLDIIANRRAKQLDAEHERVDAPAEQLEGELEGELED